MLNATFDHGDRLNELPLIIVFDDLIPADLCDQLVEHAHRGMKPAVVSGANTGRTISGRTNRSAWVRHHTTPALGELAEQLAALVGLPLNHAESYQVVHYATGEEYRPHFDAYDPGTPRGRRCMARGGQRLATLVGYLSDVDRGGETSFPTLGVKVQPKRGRVVLFHSCAPGSNLRHRDSLHGGSKVLKGEKWSVNLWFHESKFQR